MAAFEFQQRPFAFEAACITCQPSVGADDAVAGDDDRQGVAVVGHPHGAAGAGMADGCRDFRIGARAAVRYGEERRQTVCWNGVPAGASGSSKAVRSPVK